MNHWQKFKKFDLYKVANECQDLTGTQESNILQAFLQLSGPYVVREKFKQQARNFNTEHTSLTTEENRNMKQDFLNEIVNSES